MKVSWLAIQCYSTTYWIQIRQIEYALKHRATPKKSSGRPQLPTHAHVEELVEFVCASRKNGRMSHKQLAFTLEFNVTEDIIRRALDREGFHRRLAMRKPPI